MFVLGTIHETSCIVDKLPIPELFSDPDSQYPKTLFTQSIGGNFYVSVK